MRLFEKIGGNVQEKKNQDWQKKTKKALLELSLRELKSQQIWKRFNQIDINFPKRKAN